MPASAEYLTALRNAYQSQLVPVPAADVPPPDAPVPEEVGLNSQPLPPGADDGLDPNATHPMLSFAVPDISNDPTARLESNPNGVIKPLVPAQEGGFSTRQGSIAPAQPEPIHTGKMVPVFNASGEQIGEKEDVISPPLVKSPLSSAPVTFNATTGNAVDPKTGQDIKPRQPTSVDRDTGETVGYVPPTKPGESGPEPLDLSALRGGGGGGASAGPVPPPALSPETENAFREARAAHEELASGELERNQAETVGNAQLAQMARDQAAEMAKRAEVADTEAKQRADAIEAESKRLAEVKVDPKRWWNSKGTGDKIAYVIAAALGGFAAGWNKTPNQALQMMEREQDQDIMAQKEAIESGRGKLADMKSGLAEFYRRTGNMDQAMALTQAKNAEAQMGEIKAYMSGTNDKIIQARGQGMIAELDGKRAAALDQARAASEAARLKAMAGAGGGLNMKQLHDDLVEFQKQGDDYEHALRRAIQSQPLAMGGKAVNLPTLEGKAGERSGEKIRERQLANDEANAMFANVKRSPVLDKTGIVTDKLAKLPDAWAPESNITAAQIKGLNLELLGAASKVLKDNEGRIPPATLERLHELEIPLNTSNKEVALARIQAYQDFVNSLARQGGSDAPKPTNGAAPPKPAGFKGVE